MNLVVNIFKSTFIKTSTLLLALVINILLFTILPMINELIGNKTFKSDNNSSKRVIVAEYIKKKDVKKKTPEKRIRKISMSKSGKRSSESSSMRFTPDLSAHGSGVAIKSDKLEAVVFNEGETDEDLVSERITPIPYPNRARDLGIEGILEIEIIIGTSGKVEHVDIINSPHPSFDKAAKNTIKSWKFKPAKNQGVPVRVKARKEIEFKLN